MFDFFIRMYNGFFAGLERATHGWLIGLAGRFVFASVLLFYFWNSALTKIGPGVLGFLHPTDGAFAQILPSMMEAVSYDTSKLAFFPYHVIVIAGTWAEFILPALITIGLFTRAASLGMIGFIAVMSYVDVYQLGADATAIGAMFDGNPSSMIADQRLLWGFLLLVLTIYGPGRFSIDWVLRRALARRARYY